MVTTKPDAGKGTGLEPIYFSSFLIDRRGGRLTRAGETIPLRPKTWAVLVYLAERPGMLVSSEDLLDAIWSDVAVTPDTLRKSIGELRAALDDDSKTPRFIETVHRRGFRFIAEVGRVLDHGPRATSHQPPPTFVGREAELKRLASDLEQARAGMRQIVMVTGPAGVGKTALVEAFLDSQALGADDVLVGRGACLELHGAHEAYMPVLDALERLTRGAGTESTVELLRHTAPDWLAQMPWLLADHRETSPQAFPSTKSERMLREFAAFIEALAEKAIVVLVLEDLHWSDPSTVDLLSFLGQRRETARLLMIATYRPADVAVYNQPLSAAVRRLKVQGQCHELAVHELMPEDVSAYIEKRLPGADFPPSLPTVLHRHTDGNPLFVGAVVDHMIARGLILDTAPGWALAVALDKVDLGIPEDVRQMVVTQLDTFAPADRELLEAASVGGVEFAVQALAPALGWDREDAEARCETLARAHRFLRAAGSTMWPDGSVARRYAFTHELYRQSVYLEIPDGRRCRLHQKVGEALEAAFGERSVEIASMLAMHFDRGGDHRRALGYLRAAAIRARQRFALPEAAGNLEAAIAHARQLTDEAERQRHELELRLMLLPIVSDLYGFGSERLMENCSRAHELCSRIGTPEQRFLVAYALAHIHAVRCDRLRAPPAIAELSVLADRVSTDTHRLIAASSSMRTAVHEGRFLEACRIAEEQVPPPTAAPIDVPVSFGADPISAVWSHYALAQWMLGDPRKARRTARAALERAERSSAPFTLASALWFGSLVEMCCRDTTQARELADRCASLCAEHEFALWHSLARIIQGWVRAQGDELREGIEVMNEARAAFADTGALLFSTTFLSLIAEAHLRAGTLTAGLAAVDEGLAVAETTLDRSFWPELWRLKAELLLASQATPRSRAKSLREEAAQCLQRAIELARASQAKSLELRALTSLVRARLNWPSQSEPDHWLQEICAGFGADSDNRDLAAARALLSGKR